LPVLVLLRFWRDRLSYKGVTNLLRQGVTLFLIFMSIFQCRPQNIKTEDSTKTVDNLYPQSQSPSSLCGEEGFTRSDDENLLDEIWKPFVVREIKGKIINKAGDDGWPKDARVLLEIRGIVKDSQIKRSYADEKGNFVMKNIPEGRYCFRAHAVGWQVVMGIIIVDKKADPNNKIVFTMPLGF